MKKIEGYFAELAKANPLEDRTPPMFEGGGVCGWAGDVLTACCWPVFTVCRPAALRNSDRYLVN